jgi:bisanhydrobacterioruberin hydratase
MNKKINLHKTALFIALLLHICGLIGILLTQYKDWFIKNTWINLLVMAALIVLTHRLKNKSFLIFFIITFIAGFAVEVLGMNTGLIFGRYTYGDVLGIKLFNVPLIIGINWFIIIYCTGMFIQAYENYMMKKLIEREIIINNRIKLISFIVDACFLALIFDWVMEPVAVKLGYWQWETAGIPLYNYISWLIVSAALLTLFRKLNGDNRSIFAVHLFIIQLLFFLVLRTFL